MDDDTAYPPDWPADPLKAPNDLEVELTRDEQLIIELHERPKKEMMEEEGEKMAEEIEDIRREMLKITKEKFEYQRDVNR